VTCSRSHPDSCFAAFFVCAWFDSLEVFSDWSAKDVMDAKFHRFLLEKGVRKDVIDILEKEEVCFL
jgi:hypothetical protein